MKDLTSPSTLVQLRDEQLRTAINALKATYTIESMLEGAVGDDSDERLYTEEQCHMRDRALKLLESIMYDEF